MCFYCNLADQPLKLGPLVVAAVDIDGVPQLYAHQKCIDKRESEIRRLIQ